VLKNRPLMLFLLCLGLGVLVYLDQRQRSEPAPGAVAPERATSARTEDGSEQDASANATAEGPAQLQLENPLASIDKQTLKDWVERPLFAPSRKRPAAVAAAEQPVIKVGPKLQPPGYDLLGILRDGDRAIALLRKKGEGTSFRVEVGDMIGGWRVSKMEPTSVVLEREDGTSQNVPLSRE